MTKYKKVMFVSLTGISSSELRDRKLGKVTKLICTVDIYLHGISW
jgi:hypothetical protein